MKRCQAEQFKCEMYCKRCEQGWQLNEDNERPKCCTGRELFKRKREWLKRSLSKIRLSR